jgi:hypothetical protein
MTIHRATPPFYKFRTRKTPPARPIFSLNDTQLDRVLAAAELLEPDERVTLAHVVHRLKQVHGARVTAHLLYHTALSLTQEADRQAMAEAAKSRTGMIDRPTFGLVLRPEKGVDAFRSLHGVLRVLLRQQAGFVNDRNVKIEYRWPVGLTRSLINA